MEQRKFKSMTSKSRKNVVITARYDKMSSKQLDTSDRDALFATIVRNQGGDHSGNFGWVHIFCTLPEFWSRHAIKSLFSMLAQEGIHCMSTIRGSMR